MLVLTNQEGLQKVNNEITKLNQIVEENSAEFLKLKKIIKSNKNNITQRTFKEIQIIKLDQMNLRLLSDEAYYSDPVYTPEGYRYRMKILTRSTNEKNKAVYFQILRGEVDDALKWPFTKKIICALRNKDKYFAHTIASDNYIQTLNSSSFEKPTEEYNVAVGFPNFISQEELQQFIINNNLFITITIQ
ncbi:TNF receptor-associated factor 3-like [Hydra vulgaris]|uniref:TNF receptor-associated factor 3-like n=1 Tax=Hydra vulgaris TaxID=6087 RepID=A0ABM4DBM3_HYDVU